ncbi:type VI secretion system ImpA family N-terminal domain-containing protein [Novosphingobium sp.]|uniref:type VI secretion system protein TssA n=1 Tax=Novosphingobium sp. TaxID=1874826 RepID=UPI00262D28FF|nr:type VI secretion system ImpA family N-terminal domain-containing protein [Novosphingobium sp.]
MLIDDERRAAVLAPINDSVGSDGRSDEGDAADLLREIRSQRKAIVRIEQTAAMTDDDVVLPPGAWDWETLAENALDYLAEHGKDLEPMSVVVEAAARSEGLGDLAAAMVLLADLVEAFWDDGLYPAEDEDGLETRFQPLSGLSGGSNDRDGALIQPLRNLVIARTGEGDLRYLDKVRADLAMAASQGLTGEAKTARLDEASTLTRGIESHARRLSGEVLARQARLAGEAEDGWRRAIGFIIDRTKPQMPAASKLGDELRALRQWLLTMAPTQAAEDAPAGQAEAGAVAVAGEGGGAPQAGGFVAGKITRREDALKAVAAAADYFRQHEPLSPLGETLREVDRRARMSLHDFLTELIPDDSARQDFYWRSGIKPPSDEEES